MKHSLIIIISVVVGSSLLIDCAGRNTETPSTATITAELPTWCQEIPQDPNFYFACGIGTSRDPQLARDKAENAAMLDIAGEVETRFMGLTEEFREEVGTSDPVLHDYFAQATKAVINVRLRGVKKTKNKIVESGDPIRYRAYVLSEYPVLASSSALNAKLQQQEEMYTRFRATEMFKSLQEEIEKYEQFQGTQGQPTPQ